jgi:hypothetical protein
MLRQSISVPDTFILFNFKKQWPRAIPALGRVQGGVSQSDNETAHMSTK